MGEDREKIIGGEPRRCTRCVLDATGIPDITFDQDGVCNYCHEYDKALAATIMSPSQKSAVLAEALDQMKFDGRDRDYDCIAGLSGGRDSSYVMHLARVHGLRPLVVHMDNGWDAELAVRNVELLLAKTRFEYYNYVVDWNEFKDLQVAYLRSSVIDTEVVTDHAIFALLHIIAARIGVRHILIGSNPNTERTMPRGWNYPAKNDRANLLAIHRKYGRVRLRSFPLMGQYDQAYYQQIMGIRYVPLLCYVDFDYHAVGQLLETEYGWRDYMWKHCESVFTRFYQGYILPRKYHVDKRRAHLTDLVLSGQLSRADAIRKLEEPYYTRAELDKDLDYVLRKLELSRAEFDAIMASSPVPHAAFPQDRLTGIDRAKLRAWKGMLRSSWLGKRVLRFMVGRGAWARVRKQWYRKLEAKGLKN